MQLRITMSVYNFIWIWKLPIGDAMLCCSVAMVTSYGQTKPILFLIGFGFDFILLLLIHQSFISFSADKILIADILCSCDLIPYYPITLLHGPAPVSEKNTQSISFSPLWVMFITVTFFSSPPFFPISGPLFIDSQRVLHTRRQSPELAGPKKKTTWAPALKGQPHAPLQIFHLIKYTSIVSHTCEAAFTWAKVIVTRVIFNLLFEAGNRVFRATVLMREDG